MIASALAAGIVVAVQLRRGLDVALAGAAAVFIVIQAVVALVTDSATVYLAQPVVLSALWGVAYLVSAAIGRPLVGAFARAFYPFPPEVRESAIYRREFGMQSVVWGVFCFARSARSPLGAPGERRGRAARRLVAHRHARAPAARALGPLARAQGILGVRAGRRDSLTEFPVGLLREIHPKGEITRPRVRRDTQRG